MAHIKTPSLGQLDEPSAWARLEWLSELSLQIKQVKELRDKVRGRQESADGVVYDGDMQNCLTAFDAFIMQRAQLLLKPEWRLRRFNAELHETELHETELHEYEKLKSISKKCHTASHQLKKSWKSGRKELDDILQLTEDLYGNSTDSDGGLGAFGAQGENGIVDVDGEGAEKPSCKDDAGLELGPWEHGIELTTLTEPGC